ncbi:MAG TPA: 2'-5' RNA ligase family protein [Clostridium sp.]
MRYVVVSILKGEAGDFNNSLRKEVWQKFKAKSSKLPAHFTIKAPFEQEGEISELEMVLEEFCKKEKTEFFRINGYDHFDDRVIFMKVDMSNEAKAIHDRLIDKMRLLSYIDFTKNDGKDKTFHVTVTSKKLSSIYSEVWEYVNSYPCEFEGCSFDNISIFKWEDNTWKLYREFRLREDL